MASSENYYIPPVSSGNWNSYFDSESISSNSSMSTRSPSPVLSPTMYPPFFNDDDGGWSTDSPSPQFTLKSLPRSRGSSRRGSTSPRRNGHIQRATFRWQHSPTASMVVVTGTFDSWTQSIQMKRDPECVDEWIVTVPLDRRARQVFKFVVDGEWRCSWAFPTTTDECGYVNNVLEPNADWASEPHWDAERKSSSITPTGDEPWSPTASSQSATDIACLPPAVVMQWMMAARGGEEDDLDEDWSDFGTAAQRIPRLTI
ncbi:immunoglobulin E-set [Fimicolochytrium jonesii]|uniref:immunoglobulin E-set n=1 Tax=Fimicolochytrium jonesii TaxID=1396493 RepID=UPI0022FE4FFE|nr:immunoglobulin E-set [Fimicolochytrium jonesii]KAI8827019.1 immunoglobulin E-set [Fimicolochytrium jonesii]